MILLEIYQFIFEQSASVVTNFDLPARNGLVCHRVCRTLVVLQWEPALKTCFIQKSGLNKPRSNRDRLPDFNLDKRIKAGK